MADASPCKASEIRKGVTAIGAAGLIESRSKNVLRQHLTCVAEGVRLDEVVEHGADQISLRLHSVNRSSRSPLIALHLVCVWSSTKLLALMPAITRGISRVRIHIRICPKALNLENETLLALARVRQRHNETRSVLFEME